MFTNVTFSFSSCPFSICSFPSCAAQSDHLPETSNSASCLTFNASITSKTGNKQTRQSISSNLSVSPNICNSLTKGLKLHPLPLGKTEPGDANLEQSSAFQSASQTFTLLGMCWSKTGRFSHTCCTSYKEYDICCWQCAVSPLCNFSREETELQNLLQLLSTGKGNKLAPSSGRDVHGILLRILETLVQHFHFRKVHAERAGLRHAELSSSTAVERAQAPLLGRPWLPNHADLNRFSVVPGLTWLH